MPNEPMVDPRPASLADECHPLFLAWQALETRRQELQNRCAEIRRTLLNVGDCPEARQYRNVRAGLEGRADAVRAEYRNAQDKEHRLSGWIAIRRAAAAGSEEHAAIVQGRLQTRTERLVRLEGLGAPLPIIENERWMTTECIAPIAELQERLQELSVRTRAVKQELDARERDLEEIQEQYRAFKRAARENLTANEQAARDLHTEIRLWATENLERLAFAVSQNILPNSELVAAFQQRHPDISLPAGLAPPDARPVVRQMPPTSLSRKRRRARKERAPAGVGPEPARAPSQPWRFVFTTEAFADTLLPGDPEEQQTVLGALLKREGLVAARPELIIRVLARVTQMTVQQWQELPKLAGVQPEGWKVTRAATYRIFLKINEEERSIRFLVRHRRDAYAPRRRA